MSRPGVYGDPLSWQDVPPAITAAVVSALYGYGWTSASAVASRITVPLDGRAVGLSEPAARGEHLHAEWGIHRPEWTWTVSRPDAARYGGHRGLLLAPSGDPHTITAQILRLLRTGRALP